VTYPQTARTTAKRDRGRITYERATAHAILDEAYFCHLGFVIDGEPRILPTLFARLDETVYLHGSTGSRPLLAARTAEGLPVCVTVTLLDGIVYGRSHFHHSANYRSVVAHGQARLVGDEAEKRRALAALVEKVGPGRYADSRPPTRKELAETAVLALPLAEVSVKARLGAPIDDPADYHLPYWAGVVPLRLTPGIPEPDAGVTVPVPAYLLPPRSPWLTAEPMRGERVILEPLDMSHVDELYAATGDPEVWQYTSTPRPRDRDEFAAHIARLLSAHQRGERVLWAQRSVLTGELVGTTGYAYLDEADRCLEIGHTVIGRPWWRTGVNREAKLLLLARAFEELGTVRVEWHTDVRNERSQRAIERLGATREGIRRSYRHRGDGSPRDSVLYAMTAGDWPAAKARLTGSLRPPAGPPGTAAQPQLGAAARA
jgi:RimJ/RimL family protein N-acetyltransferase/nitroimidazol reductase NimA-like FMN-containing flavoprotein (pyridoxamine 5'-phosphate oxidase superfamily)